MKLTKNISYDGFTSTKLSASNKLISDVANNSVLLILLGRLILIFPNL